MPDLRKELSLSTIIGLASLIIVMVGVWTALNSTITGVEAKVSDHDRRLSDMESDNKSDAADTKRMLQDIAEIKTDLRYLREAMDRDSKN